MSMRRDRENVRKADTVALRRRSVNKKPIDVSARAVATVSVNQASAITVPSERV